MSQVIFIAHLPLLRMSRQADYSIGSGVLTKLPWEQFDSFTQGAFTDWRPKYEATDPVFFWHQQDMDLPFVHEGNAQGIEEIKLSAPSWKSILGQLELSLIVAFHEQLVDPVRAALALAAPAGLATEPRSSVTFFMPAGAAHFKIGNREMNGVRVQGDTDMELAFLPNAACEPLDDVDLARSAGLVAATQGMLGNPDIEPSLRQLLDTADVTLAPSERLLLAVSAIENLLLPDVTVGSGTVFAQRLSNLLGRDTTHRAAVFETARDLYRRRSAAIHANADKTGGIDFPPATAEQLLAGAIEAVGEMVGSGIQIDAIRNQLDQEDANNTPAHALPLTEPSGLAPSYRLGPTKPWVAGTFSSSGSLSSPEGTIVSWSPLIGLVYPGEQGVTHPELGIHLTAMNPGSIVAMEEKDIRRDFISKVRLDEAVAGLAVTSPHEGSIINESQVLPLTRLRDLTVAGLRLDGFASFIDPELLGWYVYDGYFRHRRETVLRQSIIMAIDSAPGIEIDTQALAQLQHTWALLAEYERDARNLEVDRILDLYRRIHDRRFLPTTTRARLAWICLESMLGRFQKSTSPVSLEAMVASLPGLDSQSGDWFTAQGRQFRNQTAHGNWTPEEIDMPDLWRVDHEPISHLLAISRAALRSLLTNWVEADPPVRARHGPERLHTRTLKKRLA